MIDFQSPSMRRIHEKVKKIANSPAPVLITGDTGTGKEIIADLIHNEGHRNKLPHIKVNCAAIPENLIESELFGNHRGSFTGATQRTGLFAEAGEGSIFLDEIGEMPMAIQSKLLRVLQDRQVRPLGGNQLIPINCRIVAATNVGIEKAIQTGTFRSDLFFRLGVVQIKVPPLSERKEDIPALAEMFLEHFSRLENKPGLFFESGVIDGLLHHHWPGNIRELQNCIHHGVLVADKTLTLTDIMTPSANYKPAPEALTPRELQDRELILRVLLEHKGNKLAASKVLGMGRQTLYNKIKKYELDESLL